MNAVRVVLVEPILGRAQPEVQVFAVAPNGKTGLLCSGWKGTHLRTTDVLVRRIC
jgi:hypothetical protein